MTPPNSSEENEKKKPKMDRVTVSLDEFDYKVISKMAKNRNIGLSEATRIVIHNWIETNPDKLKTNYGVNIEDLTEQIALASMIDSVNEIINELPQIFQLVDDISLIDLADHLEINVKAIKHLFFTQGEEIKKLGMNLKFKGDRIYKLNQR
jgi:hypothetical protein